MRRISSLLLTIAMFAVPLSAQAEGKEAKETKAAPAKHSKRKTASKPTNKGAISIEKLKQEVAGKIAQERDLVEKTTKASKGEGRKAFEGAVAQVKAKLSSAVHDGLVTKDELKGVRGSYKLMAVKQSHDSKTAKASKTSKK